MVLQGSQHFARMLTGQSCVLDTSQGATNWASCSARPLPLRAQGMHTSTSGTHLDVFCCLHGNPGGMLPAVVSLLLL